MQLLFEVLSDTKVKYVVPTLDEIMKKQRKI